MYSRIFLMSFFWRRFLRYYTGNRREIKLHALGTIIILNDRFGRSSLIPSGGLSEPFLRAYLFIYLLF